MACACSPTLKNHCFVVMESAIGSRFRHGPTIFGASHMGLRSLNVRTTFAGSHQPQPTGIMKISEVHTSSLLCSKPVIAAAKRSILDNDTQITVDSEEGMPKGEIAGSSSADEGVSETVVNEVEGFDTKESVAGGNVSQGGSIQGQKTDRGESNSSLKAQGTKLLDSWSSWNAQYQKDRQVWGVGLAPVFAVYQSGDAKVLRVLVNEVEILRRFGDVPFLADRPDEPAISIVQGKIAQAKQLARDIETGVFIPPANSTVFEFVKPAEKDLKKRGLLGSVFCQSGSVIGPASPALRISLVGFLLLSGFGLLWAARKHMFRNAQMLAGEIDEEQKMLMRRIESTMEKEKTDGGSS